MIEVRRYGASSIQVARRLRALYDHLLDIAEDEERVGIQLEQRLLDEELATAFADPDERAIARRPDWLGLGSAA